jgi:hypothetical protein
MRSNTSKKTAKIVSAASSVINALLYVSKNPESTLKLTKFNESLKEDENKEVNKEQTVNSKIKPEENNPNQFINDSNKRNTVQKVTSQNVNNLNKERTIKQQPPIKGEKIPFTQNPVYNKNDNDGQKTMICWNCQNVLLIGDDWDIVQCTNCDKLNKVPEKSGGENNIYSNIFNNKVNHFETNIPYIFLITICPYCGKQNKVHKGTQHLVCYKCNHSFNIESDNPGGNKVKFHTGASTLSSHNSNSIKISDIMSSNQMNLGSSQPQIIYPFNVNMCPQINGFDYAYNYIYNPLYYPYYGNVMPAPVYENYLHNPAPNRNYMLDYYLRKRMKRNNQNINSAKNKPYDDIEQKNQLIKIKERLNKINNDLDNPSNNFSNVNKSSINIHSELKDQRENSKLSKNEAVYKSLIMR